jgi:hypothetical protein
VFGIIKSVLGFRQFLLRLLDNRDFCHSPGLGEGRLSTHLRRSRRVSRMAGVGHENQSRRKAEGPWFRKRPFAADD